MSEIPQPSTGLLSGWTVVLTRPVGQNTASASRLRRLGARPVSLPAFQLIPDDSAAARAALALALKTEALVFTSPAAVRAAQGLQPDWITPTPIAIGVGQGTAAALRRAGWRGRIDCPARADSEGVLGLEAVQSVRQVGLVTAPGGRDAIAPALAARGIDVHRADVYRREPVMPRASALSRIAAGATSLATLLSSAGALTHFQRNLPTDVWDQLRAGTLVVSSDRLAEAARGAGGTCVVCATGPSPAQLVDALIRFVAGAGSCSIQPSAPTQSEPRPIRSSPRKP